MGDSVFKTGDVVKLPVFYFEFNRNKLLNTPDFNGRDSLQRVIAFLNAHPHLRVEISGHTDTRTSPGYSIRLSSIRAQTICDTLIKLGIAPLRLVAKGYEGNKPLIPDVEIKKLKTKEEQERAHQINRRIELKILSTDYGKRKTMRDSVFEISDIITCCEIYWDPDDGARLKKPTGKDSADAMVSFLKKNKNLAFELGIHTDYRGSGEYNFLLSEERAKMLAAYLIRNGIDSSRVQYRGYGETRPLVLQKNITLPSGKTVYAFTELDENFVKQFMADKNDFEFLNGLNRRTEMKIVRIER